MAEADVSWIERAADDVLRHAGDDADRMIVCASGISPSGPIHLGNLREAMTAHLVADEIRRRGRKSVHLHSWDDYDRLRKVPAGLDESFAEHVGRPLSAVPDPCGEHDSYATHFIEQFRASLRVLGVKMHEIRQSERYPAGEYNPAVRVAMDKRGEVFDILARYQTEGRHTAPLEERRAAYYPFKPYCEQCGRDTTTVQSYDGTVATYRCACGHTSAMDLSDQAKISGKLVWKVDWPARWVHEGVVFEPAGEDHHAPTSSFASGREIARDIFGGEAPFSFPYSFVGMSGGSSKMSSSAGGAAVPATALKVLEPAMVRWLYARRLPAQSFSIDLTPRGVQRLYDEWDQFLERSAEVDASLAERHLRTCALSSSAGDIEHTRRPVSFRMLASAADITQANETQIERIVRAHLTSDDLAAIGNDLLPSLRPRLNRAVSFATELLSEDERTKVGTEFDTEAWSTFDEDTKRGVRILAERLGEDWSLDGLTYLVYGVPKILVGLPLDAKPTPELKKIQRQFFIALYRLLCAAETGPRLPTLMLSIGQDVTRMLLSAPADDN